MADDGSGWTVVRGPARKKPAPKAKDGKQALPQANGHGAAAGKAGQGKTPAAPPVLTPTDPVPVTPTLFQQFAEREERKAARAAAAAAAANGASHEASKQGSAAAGAPPKPKVKTIPYESLAERLGKVTYDKVRPVVDAALSHATEEVPVATVLVLADAIDRFVGALHTRDVVSAELNLARHLPGPTRDAVTAAVRKCDEPKLFVATAQLLRRIVDLARNGSPLDSSPTRGLGARVLLQAAVQHAPGLLRRFAATFAVAYPDYATNPIVATELLWLLRQARATDALVSFEVTAEVFLPVFNNRNAAATVLGSALSTLKAGAEALASEKRNKGKATSVGLGRSLSALAYATSSPLATHKRAGEFVPTARLVADHAIDALLAGPSAADAFVELLAELGRVKNDAAYQAWLVATLMRALAQPACVAKWRTCFEQHLQASSVLLARLRAAPPAAAASTLPDAMAHFAQVLDRLQRSGGTTKHKELSHISKAQLAEMAVACHALQEEQTPAATGGVALVRIVQLALVVVAVLAAWQPAAVQAGWARMRAALL